jgi:hypothetical protein
VLPGAAWGFVDEDGNVQRKGCERLEPRVIGKLAGRSRYSALSFFVDRFGRLERQADTIARELSKTANKGRFSERVERLIKRVRTADALGDFDALLGRLEVMLGEIEAYQTSQATAKADLCERVEELAASTNWRSTTAKMKELQKSWNKLGSAGRNEDDQLWRRFRGSLDEYFRRRDENLELQKQEREQAKQAKRELCERAEALADSTDWKATSEEQARLMESWKAAGWAGRNDDEKLWKRFRAARSRFFEHRDEDRGKRREQLLENGRRKEAICEAVEALLESQDLYAAREQAKQLQSEWKKIGPAPRSVADKQWKRFRAACDGIFEKSKRERAEQRAERSRTRRQFVSRAREQAEVLRESIARDRGHLQRWQQALEGLRKTGGQRMQEELGRKIGEVETRLAEKRARLDELEAELIAEREKER